MFTFVGQRGHLEPLLPLARAARAAGHTVAFAPDPRLARTVEALGFSVLGHAPPPDPGPPRRKPLAPIDRDHEERLMREAFIGRIARERAPQLLDLLADWRPDVVVSDETDFAAAVAADRAGVPRATVVVLAAGRLTRPEVVAEPFDRLRADHGLRPGPALSRDLVLSPFPPSLRDPALPLPAHAVSIRLHETPPPDDDARTVYFTLGTVFNLECGDLFVRVVAGLRELGVPVIVTVGDAVDPAELGPQPPHVRVGRHIDQRSLLPRCAAVVSHAGSGSLLGALAHGLPSVLLPLGADQPENADRCHELGVARVLDPLTATSERVRAAVAEVLEQPRYRRAAERLRDELARLPGPEYAIELLTRRPRR